MNARVLVAIDPSGLSDIILFPPGSDLEEKAKTQPLVPGVFKVCSHGNPKTLFKPVIGPDGKPLIDPADGEYVYEPISITELVELIKKHPRFKPPMTVLLISCNSGNGMYPEDLADKLKCRVAAYCCYVTFFRGGHIASDDQDVRPWDKDRHNVPKMFEPDCGMFGYWDGTRCVYWYDIIGNSGGGPGL